ncbi:hypothetical protein [Actinokineospora sp.]|uniref:hypothetical protein n=1 Tax=Actinokineospora sp. TaxID=1872133 RepID=UPI0040379F2F
MQDQALLVPIGHSLGAFHPGDGTDHVQQVRVGADVVELGDTDFGLWALAHGLPDSAGGPAVPCTRAGLREAAADTDSLPGFLRTGLIAEVTPGSAESVEFASTHRLVPLALGLGNDAEQPWLYSVGLLYQPLVLMTGALYDLWQWAHLAPDLWSACREAAGVAEAAGVTEPEQTQPELVLAGLFGSLHQLLSAHVACVDVRIEGLG